MKFLLKNFISEIFINKLENIINLFIIYIIHKLHEKEK